jgi:hypothetical protein
VYEPYILDPSNPADAATTGDNWRDNAEQIYLESPAAGTYLVSVTHKGTLAGDQAYSIAASAPLTTTGPDTEDPEVTVTSPNGGEVWDIDSFFDVTWIATDNVGVTSIDILLSTDGGATYPEVIATGEVNDGIYSWQVDGEATTQARVKVIAYDGAGNSGEDASDADFEIYDPASGVDVTREIPTAAVIAGNSPNPFSKATEIRFGIPADGRVQIDVYDVGGRVVGTVVDRIYSAGYHSVSWQSGVSLGMGLYVVRLRFEAEEVMHKVVLSR